MLPSDLERGIPLIEYRRPRWWKAPEPVQVGWIAPPMTGYDLAEWAAFERSFGPIVPHERIDAAQAMLSSVIARTTPGAKGDLRPVTFLPQWEGPKEQSADQMVEALRRMARKEEPPSQPSRN